jgi:hypothetical protein
MALFDAPNLNYPTQWRDFSLDNKMGLVYFGCMVLLSVFGDSLSVKEELVATMLVAAVLVSFSVRHRQKMNWHWPGVEAEGVLTALVILLVGGIFEFASSGFAPRSDPTFLPWHLAGLGGAVLAVLTALRVVQLSESDFLKQCGAVGVVDSDLERSTRTVPLVPTDPLWKRVGRATFYILAFLVWLDAMAFFYCFDVASRHGSAKPTPTQTEPLNSGGVIVYIQHSQRAQIDFLQNVMSIGIPSIMASGLILHFLLEVKLLPDTPTLKEWREQRRRK